MGSLAHRPQPSPTSSSSSSHTTVARAGAVELIVDAAGRVCFATAAARAWLAKAGLADVVAEQVRAMASAVGVSVSAVAPATRIDSATILRLEGDDGRVLFLVHVVPASPSPAIDILTKTQRLVAERAALGMTIDDVAGEMAMTAHTARSHLKEIYRRLHVANRIELANALRVG